MSIDTRPLSEFTDQWVFSVDCPDEWWWTVGPVDHLKADGTTLAGTLVFAVAADSRARHTFRLRVVGASAPVRTVAGAAELSVRPEDAEPEGTPWMRAWKIAQVIVNGEGVSITYQGKKDPAPRERRLDALIPTKDGRGVFAHDLQKEAPRQFRLDRITEVHAAFLSHRKLDEAVAAIPDPPPNPQCYQPQECAGLSSCPRSPSCSS